MCNTMKASQRHRPRISAAYKNYDTIKNTELSNICYLNLTVCKYFSKLYLKNVFWTASDVLTENKQHAVFASNLHPANLSASRGKPRLCGPASQSVKVARLVMMLVTFSVFSLWWWCCVDCNRLSVSCKPSRVFTRNVIIYKRCYKWVFICWHCYWATVFQRMHSLTSLR